MINVRQSLGITCPVVTGSPTSGSAQPRHSSSLRSLSKRSDTELVIGKGGERHQTGWSCHIGNDEPVEVVEHGAGDDFPEHPHVTLVGPMECREVCVALLLEHDHRRIPEPDEQS